MTQGPRFSSRHRWYYLDLKFVLDHVPHVLCPQGCSHNPCQPPVVPILVVDPRGRGRPRLTNDDVKLILAEAIHAVQRRPDKITQEAVCEQANWAQPQQVRYQGQSEISRCEDLRNESVL
jgi:hypothetical protein